MPGVVDRRAAPVVVAALAALAAGAIAALPVTDARALPAMGELRLWMETGRIELQAGEQPQVEVEAELPPGMALRWREHAGGISLRVVDPHRLVPRQARIVLRIPATAGLRLDVGDADALAQGVGGAGAVIRGGRGAIEVRDPAGTLVVESSSGAIRVQAARPGRLRLRSLGGAVDLGLGTTQAGDIRVETFTGPITLRLAPGAPAVLQPRLARRDLVLPAGATGRPDGSVVLGDGGGRVVLESFGGTARVVSDPGIDLPEAAPASAEATPPVVAGGNETPTSP